VSALRLNNLVAITLLSLGTPMLLMGDEVRGTQRGNNVLFGMAANDKRGA